MAPHLGEEVYEHYSDCFKNPQPSVFRSGWNLDRQPEEWNNAALRDEFSVLKQLRVEANQLLEQARTAKDIRSSLEATIEIQVPSSSSTEESEKLTRIVESYADDLKTLFITSDVTITKAGQVDGNNSYVREILVPRVGSCKMVMRKATLHKCPRCWTFTSPEPEVLCPRCGPVVAAIQA